MGKEQQIIRDRIQRLIEGIKKANWKNCDAEHTAQLVDDLLWFERLPDHLTAPFSSTASLT